MTYPRLAGGAALPRLGTPEVPRSHHSKPRAHHAALQRAAVLGVHGAVPVRGRGPAGPAPPQVYQAGGTVSDGCCEGSGSVAVPGLGSDPSLRVFACSLKEQKNLNSFFAVMFGLSNTAVSRLAKTWEVPSPCLLWPQGRGSTRPRPPASGVRASFVLWGKPRC